MLNLNFIYRKIFIMQVGYHVDRKEEKNAAHAIDNACKAIITYGFTPSLQIFLTNPRRGGALFDDNELASIKETINKHNASMYVHGAYIDIPWKKSPYAINNIVKEMKMSKECGALGVVIHLSKDAHGGNLAWVLDQINNHIHDDSVILFLEINTAKSSKFTFETPEKILELMSSVSKLKLNYQVGLCIDTAHLFSCGTSLTYTSEVNIWFNTLMKSIGDIPLLLHLNDSASTLGSGKDRHEKLCQGTIWNATDDDCGLKTVLEWTQLYNVPIILERDSNGDATDDLQILQLWQDHGSLV